MNPLLTPTQILAEIAKIQSMEFGKLSEYQHPGRSKDSTSYFRLQYWKDGKNHSRHVRPEELPALRAALEGYSRFVQLSEMYAQSVVERTRQHFEEDVKKKILPYSRHSSRKSSKS